MNLTENFVINYYFLMEDIAYNVDTEEKVNHPNYYNRYSVEVIEMARRIWGDEAMKTCAEITAFIYRMRAGVKPDNPIQQDIDKEEFWLNYAKKLK